MEGRALYRDRLSPNASHGPSGLREIFPALSNHALSQLAGRQTARRRDGNSAGQPVIAVTGLRTEARIAAGPQVLTVAGGCDVYGLAQSVEAAAASAAAAIISFGIAGGLAPELAPGTKIVARSVVAADGERYFGCPAWSQRLSRALGGVPIADIAGVDAPLTGHAEKRALHIKTGALAADTESHIAAKVAAAYGLPFAAFRVIADPAHRQLPHAALVAIKPDGSLALGAITRSLLRNPRQVPLLLEVARDARAAFAALFRGRQMLTGALGFSDFGELLLDMPAENVLGGPLRV